jgi:Bardet-Biedl syndrome 9 protein
MSVFQLEEWWTHLTTSGSSSPGAEEFDVGCIAVGNVDNATPASPKIVLGSQAGVLRIYAPTKPGFRVEDLILEESLPFPILQLSIGRFIPSSPGKKF